MTNLEYKPGDVILDTIFTRVEHLSRLVSALSRIMISGTLGEARDEGGYIDQNEPSFSHLMLTFHEPHSCTVTSKKEDCLPLEGKKLFHSTGHVMFAISVPYVLLFGLLIDAGSDTTTMYMIRHRS